MTKAPTPTEKSKKQRENTKTPPKTSITQRLRTDLGRSAGATIKTVYQKYIKTSARVAMLCPSGREVQGIKESRLTIRGDEDRGLVSSDEVWTNPVI